MSRKVCKRKHWLPVNPITLAISGATITTEADLDRLRMRELGAIEAFAKGNARPEEFRDLCDLLNLAETMVEQGIEPEAAPAIQAAEAAMLEMKARHDLTGKFGMTAASLAALRMLFAWHDAQRKAISRSTYEKAIQRTVNKIRSAHPGVRVLA